MGNPIVNLYLIAYNLACCAGWGLVLSICVKHIIAQSIDGLWEEIEMPLKIVQTAAVLEIFNSMVGLVRSPWFTTFLQVFSRVWVLWAIMDVAAPVQHSWFLLLASTSWGLVEVPRYLFYALNIVGMVPYPLFWLRYSLFAILYPTGITGELGCTYVAMQYIYDNPTFLWQPAAGVAIPFFWIVALVTASYIPGSPKMYMHMLVTRRKQFKSYGKEDTKEKKSRKD